MFSRSSVKFVFAHSVKAAIIDIFRIMCQHDNVETMVNTYLNLQFQLFQVMSLENSSGLVSFPIHKPSITGGDGEEQGWVASSVLS